MKLHELLKEWQRCNELVKREDEPIPFSTRSGFMVAINQAKDRKKLLEKDYKTAIFQDCVAIFVTGDDETVKDFIGAAKKSYGTDVVVESASSLYERAADSIRFVIDSKLEIRSAQLLAVFRSLEDACKEAQYEGNLDVASPQTIRTILDFKELVRYTKSLIQDQNGVQPSVAYTKHVIAMSAFAAEFDGTTLPVILYNVNEEEKEALRKVFTEKGTIDITLKPQEQFSKEFISNQLRNAKKATEEIEIDIEE